jgi:hypothetical protein
MRRVALDGVYQLKQQISYIQASFEMEQEDNAFPRNAPEPRSLTSLGKLNQMSKAAPEKAIASPANHSVEDWYEGGDLFDSNV